MQKYEKIKEMDFSELVEFILTQQIAGLKVGINLSIDLRKYTFREDYAEIADRHITSAIEEMRQCVIELLESEVLEE